MVKNVFWDFDGVILDSMKIKGEGFIELFSNFNKNDLNLLYKFHIENGGVSRFDKIRYFYREILGQEIDEEKVLQLAKEFGEIVSVKLLDSKNLIIETLEFIEKHYKTYSFHIVSGAEDSELKYLCGQLGIKKYFLTIDGSPTAKKILVKNILDQYSYNKNECVLIGDAFTDYHAAKENGISFYGYNNEKLKSFDYIKTFEDFSFE